KDCIFCKLILSVYPGIIKIASLLYPRSALLTKFIWPRATMVPITNNWEIENYVITSVRLNEMPPTDAAVILFFNAKTGLKFEIIKAGYKPDKITTINVVQIKNNSVPPLNSPTLSGILAIFFKLVKNILAIKTANVTAITTIKVVSRNI